MTLNTFTFPAVLFLSLGCSKQWEHKIKSFLSLFCSDGFEKRRDNILRLKVVIIKIIPTDVDQWIWWKQTYNSFLEYQCFGLHMKRSVQLKHIKHSDKQNAWIFSISCT